MLSKTKSLLNFACCLHIIFLCHSTFGISACHPFSCWHASPDSVPHYRGVLSTLIRPLRPPNYFYIKAIYISVWSVLLLYTNAEYYLFLRQFCQFFKRQILLRLLVEYKTTQCILPSPSFQSSMFTQKYFFYVSSNKHFICWCLQLSSSRTPRCLL